jgi:signal transduction histidine kinase
VTGVVPYLHRRLVRSSRWRVAALGALVVVCVLGAMSAGGYAVMRAALYAHLEERLERAAADTESPDGHTGYLAVDERGDPLPGIPRPEDAGRLYAGFQVITDPRLGPLAVLSLPSPSGGQRMLVTPAQEQTRALSVLVWVLVALTLTGGIVALPVGYALAGVALHPLDAAVRERTKFVALASHQLRTPLAVIRTSAELAQASRGLTPGEALRTILVQTQRMEALAARLTALARAESQTRPAAARTDLAEITRVAVAALRDVAGHKGVTVTADLEPVHIAVDADEATDMLTVILENAVQFSPAGSAVAVRVRRQGTRAVAEVQDRGPGIRPEDLPLVTAPFYQGRTVRGRSGLGLTIARAIAERHGGRLAISSGTDRGTTVAISLPGRPAPTGSAAS